jgi:trehalose 6-phosphate phosphatase
MQHLLSSFGDFERLVRSKSLLFLATDFDGTLCPIADAPASVAIPRRISEVLQRLTRAQGTTVAIVTGRALDDIKERLPLDVVYAGNHGLEISGRGLQFRHPHAEAARRLLTQVCAGLELTLEPWDGAWVENKGLTVTVHYRRVPEADQNTLALAVRAHMQRFDTALGVRGGRKAIEIYPRANWNKGKAVEYIREQLQLVDALCVCIGDDETDETMFSMFPDDVSIRVQLETRSSARYYLDDCYEVLTALEHLSVWREAPLLRNSVVPSHI